MSGQSSDVATKACAKCGDVLPLTGFHQRSDQPGRYRSECKVCWRRYFKEWVAKNPERYKSTHRRNAHQQRINSPEYKQRQAERAARMVRDRRAVAMLNNAKVRAKKLGLPFSITMADLNVPDVCPVLGIPLLVDLCDKHSRPDGVPSIDRIVPSLGYVPGNVAVISWRANRIKQDGAPDDWEALIRYVRSRAPSPTAEPCLSTPGDF